jgi:DNA-binding beta-propeller fold protein YncE
VVNVVSIPTSFLVTPPAAIIPPGDSVAVNVLVLDSIQNLVPGATVTFQVSNPSLLTMTSGGYARSVGPTGNVTVTVTSGALQTQLPFAVATVHVPAVVSTQPVGQRPYAIRLAPGGTAYISDIGDGSLYRGTAPGYQFVKVRTVGGLPLDLAINPAGTRLSVARDSLDRIEVIDLTADTVAGTIHTFPGAEPTALAYSPDGTRLYVGTGIDFRVYNAQTLALVDSVPGTGLINWITVHPTQPRVYLSTGSILEIDVGSMTIVRQFTGGQLQATVLSPTADTLYVTTEDGDTRAYHVSSGQLLATAVGGGRGMALSGDGSYLFATDYNNHRLSVIFSPAMINVTVLDVGGGAARIAFIPGGNTALLPNTGGWVDIIQ